MSFTNKNSQKKALGLVSFSLFIAVGLFVFAPSQADAATLTVDSKADNTTIDNNCTLREAITNVNDQTNTYADCTGVGSYGVSDTIEFSISGTADFTVSGKDGYTIAPTSGLPSLNESVTINGYSQLDASPNSAISPNPLNGILLIEIDGTSAGSADGITFVGNNLTVKGLVINNFAVSAKDGISVAGNNNRIQGCYIGTEPDGMTPAPNDLGVSNHVGSSDGLLVGGTNPEDRNIMSGNYEGASSPNTGHINWTYQGNYIGVGKDGLTAVPNAQIGGSGSISIDNDDGHLVGGTQPGAKNVISGNRSMGIAPHNTDNLVVQGNYFGVGYDGVTPVPNGGAGINISDSLNYLVGGTAPGAGNIIHNNENGGISITGTSDTGNIEGNSIVDNQVNGIFLFGANNTVIGGNTPAHRNHIANNGVNNISLLGFGSVLSGVVVQGNYIGTNADGSINSSYTATQSGIRIVAQVDGVLIGGANNGEGNLIAGNGSFGIGVDSRTVTAFSLTATPINVSILGNSIYGNENNDSTTQSSGLGIDLFESTDNEPDGVPDFDSNVGPSLNDLNDSDDGPNEFMNFPILNSATQNGTSLKVNLDLDAADSTLNDQYRVEVFANDTADASGFGEGKTFLGSATITNGNAQDVTITVPNGTNLTGKVLSATTTALSNTGNGFGATSEFSEVSDVIVLSASTDGRPLAETGARQSLPIVLTVVSTSFAIVYGIRTRRWTYSVIKKR